MDAALLAIKDAIENIDAGMFSGDSFHDKNLRSEFQATLERWSRGLKEFEPKKPAMMSWSLFEEPKLEKVSDLLSADQIANFPVQHISASAIRSYLTDRQSFFKRYVRLEFEMTKGPSLIEGSLFHSVLELYWQEHKEGRQDKFDVEAAFQSRLQQAEIDQSFEGVNWWSTGSKEKSIETVQKSLGFYFAELPKWTTDQIIGIEARFLSDFEDLEGNSMPIPLKGFLDLIVKDGEDIIVEDHKLVSVCTEQDKVDPKYEIQACEYWFLIRKQFWLNPKRMIFRQVKKSKNRDWSPQIVPYVVEYNAAMLNRFLEIYRRMVKELSGQPLIDEATGVVQFLPNPYAAFWVEESWNDFCAEVDSGKQWTLEEIRAIKPNKFQEDVDALDL